MLFLSFENLAPSMDILTTNFLLKQNFRSRKVLSTKPHSCAPNTSFFIEFQNVSMIFALLCITTEMNKAQALQNYTGLTLFALVPVA